MHAADRGAGRHSAAEATLAHPAQSSHPPSARGVRAPSRGVPERLGRGTTSTPRASPLWGLPVPAAGRAPGCGGSRRRRRSPPGASTPRRRAAAPAEHRHKRAAPIPRPAAYGTPARAPRTTRPPLGPAGPGDSPEPRRRGRGPAGRACRAAAGGAGRDAGSLTCHRRAPSGRRRGGCGASCGGRRAMSPADPAEAAERGGAAGRGDAGDGPGGLAAASPQGSEAAGNGATRARCSGAERAHGARRRLLTAPALRAVMAARPGAARRRTAPGAGDTRPCLARQKPRSPPPPPLGAEPPPPGGCPCGGSPG